MLDKLPVGLRARNSRSVHQGPAALFQGPSVGLAEEDHESLEEEWKVLVESRLDKAGAEMVHNHLGRGDLRELVHEGGQRELRVGVAAHVVEGGLIIQQGQEWLVGGHQRRQRLRPGGLGNVHVGTGEGYMGRRPALSSGCPEKWE